MKGIFAASSILIQMENIAQKEIKTEKLNMKQKTLVQLAKEQLDSKDSFEKALKFKDCQHKNKERFSRGNEDIRSMYKCHDCGQIVSIFDYDKD